MKFITLENNHIKYLVNVSHIIRVEQLSNTSSKVILSDGFEINQNKPADAVHQLISQAR